MKRIVPIVVTDDHVTHLDVFALYGNEDTLKYSGDEVVRSLRRVRVPPVTETDITSDLYKALDLLYETVRCGYEVSDDVLEVVCAALDKAQSELL